MECLSSNSLLNWAGHACVCQAYSSIINDSMGGPIDTYDKCEVGDFVVEDDPGRRCLIHSSNHLHKNQYFPKYTTKQRYTTNLGQRWSRALTVSFGKFKGLGGPTNKEKKNISVMESKIPIYSRRFLVPHPIPATTTTKIYQWLFETKPSPTRYIRRAHEVRQTLRTNEIFCCCDVNSSGGGGGHAGRSYYCFNLRRRRRRPTVKP